MKGVKTTEMQVLYESSSQIREKAITIQSQNEKFRIKMAVDRILNREVQASTDIGVNKEFNKLDPARWKDDNRPEVLGLLGKSQKVSAGFARAVLGSDANSQVYIWLSNVEDLPLEVRAQFTEIEERVKILPTVTEETSELVKQYVMQQESEMVELEEQKLATVAKLENVQKELKKIVGEKLLIVVKDEGWKAQVMGNNQFQQFGSMVHIVVDKTLHQAIDDCIYTHTSFFESWRPTGGKQLQNYSTSASRINGNQITSVKHGAKSAVALLLKHCTEELKREFENKQLTGLAQMYEYIEEIYAVDMPSLFEEWRAEITSLVQDAVKKVAAKTKSCDRVAAYGAILALDNALKEKVIEHSQGVDAEEVLIQVGLTSAEICTYLTRDAASHLAEDDFTRVQMKLKEKNEYNTAGSEEKTTLFINQLQFEFEIFSSTARISSASPTPKTEPEVKRNNVRNPRENTSKTATEAEF